MNIDLLLHQIRSYLFLKVFNLDIILYMRRAGIRIFVSKPIILSYLVSQKILVLSYLCKSHPHNEDQRCYFPFR